MIRRVDSSHRRPNLPSTRPQKPTARRLVSRDELSTGGGASLRSRLLQGAAKRPPSTYTVQPGDSYHRIAQNRATELLQQRGLTKGDATWSKEWHTLAHQLVQELMAANGGKPLRPGDQLPVVGGSQPAPKPPVDTAPVTPSSPTPSTPTTPAAPVPPTPAAPTTPGEVGSAMVNQFAGDSDGRNANCGFASSLMALKLLGKDTSQLGGTDYEKAMKLRALGGGGTNDRQWGTVNQVVNGLRAAGAQASAVPNTWGADKAKAVELMKQAFLKGDPTAFVVAGNPALGWPKDVSYNGGHFVTVAGYDQASNTFTVLDPVAKKPIQVSPEQLANYLKDGNAELGEVVQVTP
ncbi:MAG: C39 family peptidase [Myxococcaceae bacterium]|nr:C39 family peptidase [Myxococcaceae bacterium]